ncbi:MAG TPA: N-methyl-L-tryptophan oxidase [Xanthobacteraceae bacterium]
MSHFNVVVCGLGVTGSAALYQLAGRGVRVLGLERFAPGHERGSSHGETRIIRLGYFEHPSYVPLVRSAYAMWREIEKAAGAELLHVTGILEIGPPAGTLVAGTLASIRQHGLRHEILPAGELMRRFPAFRIAAGEMGVLQPEGGFLRAEPAVAAMVHLAQAAGAEIRVGETITEISPYAGGVRITTDRGVVEAGAAIVAAGPWLKTLLPKLPAAIRVTRQVMAWFEPLDPAPLGRLPAFLLESRHGIHYGFPPSAGATKVAKHHHRDQAVDPDAYDRTVTAEDEGLIRAALAEHLPAANGRLIRAKTCLYTMTPDGDFIIDRLPGAPQIVVASPCSGHGFKFAPVIGAALADLATTGATAHDISRFALSRFGGSG